MPRTTDPFGGEYLADMIYSIWSPMVGDVFHVPYIPKFDAAPPTTPPIPKWFVMADFCALAFAFDIIVGLVLLILTF